MEDVHQASRIVGELMQWLIQLRPQRETLDFIARRVSEALRFKSCAILLPDEHAGQMRIEGAYRLEEEYVQEVNMRRKVRLEPGLAGGGPTTRSYGTGQVVAVTDLQSDPSFGPWRTLAKKYGFGSMISAPLMLRGKAIGVLNGYGEQPRTYGDEEKQVMLAVAAQAALAIEISGLLLNQKETIDQLRRLTQSLRTQQTVLERLQVIHQQLTDLVLVGEGAEAIAATLARLLNRPVLAWDRFRHPVSAAFPPGSPIPEEDLAQWQGWLNDPTVTAGLTRLGSGEASLLVRPRQGAGRTHAITLAPVMVDGEVLGYLGAVEREESLDLVEQRALEQGATVLALELVKQTAVRETEERLKADFIHDLFEGRFTDHARLRERAIVYQIDLSALHQVAVIDFHDLAGFAAAREMTESEGNRLLHRLARLIGESLSGSIPGSSVTQMGDRLTCICPLPRNEQSPRYGLSAFRALLEQVRQWYPGLSALVVLGGPCQTPQDFQTAYHDALAGLEVLKRFGHRERVLALDELGLFRLMLTDCSPQRLLDAARSTLGQLLARDQRRTGDLFRTLATYLDSDCDLQGTADRLGLHPNTLKYRLRQVEEITGLHARRPQDLLQLNFAVTVCRLLGAEEGALL